LLLYLFLVFSFYKHKSLQTLLILELLVEYQWMFRHRVFPRGPLHKRLMKSPPFFVCPKQ
jgi:hypothetical protein